VLLLKVLGNRDFLEQFGEVCAIDQLARLG